jgi:hypothetical protein
MNRSEFVADCVIKNKSIFADKQQDSKFFKSKVLKLKCCFVVFLHNNERVITADQPKNSVFAISKTGKILWNIEQILRSSNRTENLSEIKCFTGIASDANENLIVYTFEGVAYVIDVEKREIIDHYVTE